MKRRNTKAIGHPWARIAGLLSMLVATAAVAEPPTVPLGDFGGRPTVDLTIGGKGPYVFILDTGAGVSVVDHGLRRELGLVALGRTEIGSPAGGTVPAEALKLENTAVGPIELGDIDALAIDLAGVIGGGDAPIGVLATNAFTRGSLTVDFSARRLSLASESLPPANGVDVFDYCSAGGKPSLTLEVEGERFCVNLDTGSPALISLPLAAAESLPLASPPSVRGQARLVGAEATLWSAPLEVDLRIGDIVLHRPELTFMETKGDGNLGQMLLRNMILTLDHANSRLTLYPGESGAASESAAGETPRRRMIVSKGQKRYGARFGGIGGDELPVLGVDDGLPAATCGLRAGDVILAMNGRPVPELSRDERFSALRGSPLELRVRRGEREIDLTLRLD